MRATSVLGTWGLAIALASAACAATPASPDRNQATIAPQTSLDERSVDVTNPDDGGARSPYAQTTFTNRRWRGAVDLDAGVIPVSAPSTPNDLTDAGPSVPDSQILADVRRAIAADGTIASDVSRVTIKVRDGVVILRGTVKNEPARASFESIARHAKGTRRVDSDLHAQDRTPIDLDPGPTGY